MNSESRTITSWEVSLSLFLKHEAITLFLYALCEVSAQAFFFHFGIVCRITLYVTCSLQASCYWVELPVSGFVLFVGRFHYDNRTVRQSDCNRNKK